MGEVADWADGSTHVQALANVDVIIREWIETVRELGARYQSRRAA